jgi:ParB family chromosome partitioning protein
MSPMATEQTGMAAPMIGPGFYREDMPLADLRRSPLNPRKHFDQAGLEELSRSIRELGIIEPLVARPVGDAFEIVAGERRFRAATLAGLEVVPCTVKHLSDSQALEIMVVENNQREDVNALEEADGFSRLLKSGYDVDRLAERLGRSKKYVYDRVKLLDLAAPAKQLLSDGVLTPGHGILLARLKPEDQLRALDVDHGGVFEHEGGQTSEEEELAEQAEEARADREYDAETGDDEERLEAGEFVARDLIGMKPKSVRETAHWIAQHVRFKPFEAADSAPLEYGEVADRVSQALLKPGRGKKVVAITFEHYIQPEARDEGDRTYWPRSFRFADGKPHRDYGEGKTTVAKACEHAVLGVVAVGEKYGEAFDVCIARDKCQVHWKSEIAERTKNQKLRDAGQGATAERRERKEEDTWQARMKRENEERLRRQEAWDAVRDRAAERLAAALKKLGSHQRLVDVVMASARSAYLPADTKRLYARLVGKVTPSNVLFAVVFGDILDDEARDHDEFAKVAKTYGVDLADLNTEYKQRLAGKSVPAAVQTSAPKKSAKKPAKKKR